MVMGGLAGRRLPARRGRQHGRLGRIASDGITLPRSRTWRRSVILLYA